MGNILDKQFYVGNVADNSRKNLYEQIIEETVDEIRDLYSESFSNTMGSHVTLYNMEYFGNIFFNYVNDYFIHMKE